MIRGNQRAIRQAFEAAGVVFLDAGEMGPGVRLLLPEPPPVQGETIGRDAAGEVEQPDQ